MSWALTFGPITVVCRAGPALEAARYAHPDHPATLQLPEVFVFNMDTGPEAHFQALVLAGVASGPGLGSGSGSDAAGGHGGGGGGGDGGCGAVGSWSPVQQQVDETHVSAALEIARCAAPLHALAPPSTWSEEQTRAWVSALAAFAPRIGPALQGTDCDKTDLVLDFLRLPVLSQGVANEHPRAEDIMRTMHPPPSRPIVAPRDLGPGLEVTLPHAQEAVRCLFRDDYTSMDFSGWNMDLLRPVKGRLDIMGPLSDLVRSLAKRRAESCIIKND